MIELVSTLEEAMIGVLVTFEYGDDFDKGRVEGVAEAAQGAFAGMPGLRLKAFTVDEEHRRATNVYLWSRRRQRAPSSTTRSGSA